jgi:hypothetical protein
VAVAVAFERLGVGEGVSGFVHPAARTTARITIANIPAIKNFLITKPSFLCFIVLWRF